MDESYVIGVDSGGTFSDCVIIDRSGTVTTGKAPSTPEDFSAGVLDSVAVAAEAMDRDLDEVLRSAILFGHGTTVATNALLTRDGSKTGLLTTKGHEDAVIIGRTYQKVAGLTESELADVANLDKATPIVPRPLIRGIEERVNARGEIVSPLDMQSVQTAVDGLVGDGVEAIAVCLLWSFLHPEHEAAVLDLIATNHPGIVVAISSDIAPVIKEYERTTSTMINAYLTRKVSRYLESLGRGLLDHGFQATPVVMQSSGGVLALEHAKSLPVRLLTSGPAGGVIGAQVFGRVLGYPNIITTDVGGTSFDVGLVVDGEAQFANQATFDKYELALPVIDVATIGAGGGSVAWIEPDTGVLRVGPRSAGAEPGPACYGLGGSDATVTDANVVLGRINPDFFLGGRQKLDGAKSSQAVEPIAESLGLGVADAAAGIIDIADAQMADLVRRVTVERGFDPRQFVLFAFGGAGPMHACAYGPAAGCDKILVPTVASVFSAFGIAGSDIMVVEEMSDPKHSPFDAAEFDAIYHGLEERAAASLHANGIDAERMYFQRYVRMRYRGQVHEVETPVPASAIGAPEIAATIEAFEKIYETKYGKGTTFRHADMRAITYRVHGFGRLNVPALAERAAGTTDATAAIKAEREVHFREIGGFAPTSIYNGAVLRPGHRIQGPAIVESVDTTVVVHPRQVAAVDSYLNIVVGPQDD
ncbi:MAG TPA: hydantoinase/oxoprolinase family protein [Rhodospirillales bacterium]|nr:hydantoinase/oxoprolinase family protein [Rhodospirillales bacterium]